MENKVKVDISTSTIIRFFLVFIAIIFLYLIRNVIIMLFIIIIIMAAFDPAVTWAEKNKIPRYLSATVLYLFIIAFFAFSIYLIIPPVVQQISSLANNLPNYANEITPLYQYVSEHVPDWQKNLGTISQGLTSVTGGIYDASKYVFGGIATAVTILIISFYLVIERPEAEKFIFSLIPEKKRVASEKIFNHIGYKLGRWLQGQFFLSIIMGIITTIISAAAGIPYALILGLIGALLEILPVIGVFVTGVLVVSSAWFFGGWLSALIVLAVFVGVHELESSLLIPKIMGKAVNLSAVTILVALLIGGTIAGMSGAILAIPAVAAIAVIFKEWYSLKEG